MTRRTTPPAPVLLVEDSNTRIEWFEKHLPDGFRLVKTGSAGRAIGALRRDTDWLRDAREEWLEAREVGTGARGRR